MPVALNPVTLRFKEKRLEDRFVKEWAGHRAQLDVGWHMLTILVLLPITAKRVTRTANRQERDVYDFFVYAAAILLPRVLVFFLFCRGRDVYLRHRTAATVCTRAARAFTLLLLWHFSFPVANANIFKFYLVDMMMSGLTNTLGFQLLFRHHILLKAISTVVVAAVSLYPGSGLCDRWYSLLGNHVGSSSAGQWHDIPDVAVLASNLHLVSAFLLPISLDVHNSSGSPSVPHPVCKPVVATTLFSMQFLLPSIILYVLEQHSRALFLKRHSLQQRPPWCAMPDLPWQLWMLWVVMLCSQVCAHVWLMAYSFNSGM